MTESGEPLYEAIKNNVDIVAFKLLLQKLPSVSDYLNDTGLTPLQRACSLKRIEMVKAIAPLATHDDIQNSIQFGIAPNQTEAAARLDVLKTLHNSGADLNEMTKTRVFFYDEVLDERDTPLTKAIYSFDHKAIEYLIEHKVNLNFTSDDHGIFPFKAAAWTFIEGDDCILPMMLKHGLDVNEQDGVSLWAFFTLLSGIKTTDTYNTREGVFRRYEQLFVVCRKYGANFKEHPYMYEACKAGIFLIRFVIHKLGLKASHENLYNGHTALHVASGDKLDGESAVEVLLEWGADVNAQVQATGDGVYDGFLTGFTALHYSCSGAELDKMETLLDYGANIHLVNCSQVSVLFQLFDAICKDRVLYLLLTTKDISSVEVKEAIHKLERFEKMARLLIASGAVLSASEYNISYSHPYVTCPDALQSSSNYLPRIKEIFDNVKEQLSKPKSLKDICRIVVRSTIQTKKSEYIDSLAEYVPSTLIDFLKMSDILKT